MADGFSPEARLLTGCPEQPASPVALVEFVKLICVGSIALHQPFRDLHFFAPFRVLAQYLLPFFVHVSAQFFSVQFFDNFQSRDTRALESQEKGEEEEQEQGEEQEEEEEEEG